MKINEYQELALRTSGSMDNKDMILNGTLGLSGESGEVADYLKKALFQGHEFDEKHIAEELGDICWYIAILSHGIGYDLEAVMQINIDKLKKRYPKGFEKERSLNRESEDK